ncbi:MAG: 6-phosphofructokinase [Armatimonadetes bacterium]|nr:6-phosphofructokinase [Armatimonadota bacterium]
MRIGILTGGGDCQGLNAAIRAVVRKSLDYNFEVYGIQRGWLGLIEDQMEKMTLSSVSGILPLGGTILGTSRTNPAKIENGYEKIEEVIKKRNIDALIPIGGDDTLGVCLKLLEKNIPAVAIPKTMDNDVGFTDYCIGFDSAVSIVTDALDKLHTTAHSHHRVIIVEVMGRDTGWVALYGGLAGGADWIMIPEVPADVQEVCEHLNRRRSLGKDFSIIIAAEGVALQEVILEDDCDSIDAFGHVRLDRRNVGQIIGKQIEKITGYETRVTILGHLQRGGSPSVFDRILATRLGIEAVKLIKYGQYGKMTAFQGNQITSVNLAEALKASPKKVSIELYQLAQMFY